MRQPKAIEHQGIITEITENVVKVNISQESACAVCHAKGACIAADVQEKIIEVDHPGGQFAVGDTVTVVLKQSLGFQALFLGYLLPFLILMAVLVTASAVTPREDVAGMAALAILVPYYLGLYLFRQKLKRKFTFTLKK